MDLTNEDEHPYDIPSYGGTLAEKSKCGHLLGYTKTRSVIIMILVNTVAVCTVSSVITYFVLNSNECSCVSSNRASERIDCQFDSDSSSEVLPTTTSLKCHECLDGWVKYKTSCYLFGSTSKNFNESSEYCRSLTSELVHIKTWDDNKFIRGYSGQWGGEHRMYWIGVTDKENENVFRFFPSNEQPYFFDWDKDEPGSLFDLHDCVAFRSHYDHSWYEKACYETAHPVCEQRSSDVSDVITNTFHDRTRNIVCYTAQTTSLTCSECLDGWVKYEKSCYLFGITATNFNESSEYCRGFNSELVHIETWSENVFLRKYTDQWKGGNRFYWIGITDQESEGDFRFFPTNKQPTFFDWDEGQPLDVNGQEDCLRFSSDHDHSWHDISCVNNAFPLCKQRL